MNQTAGPGSAAGAASWSDAVLAAAVLAIDARGIGGARLRSPAGSLRDQWFAQLRDFLGPEAVLQRMPCQVDDARLLGGIDLAASLRSGRPVIERGLLAQCDGGVLVAQMAERMSAGMAGRIAAALDQDSVGLERDGFSQRFAARVAIVACDEGLGVEEQAPACLIDRLGIWLDLTEMAWDRVRRAPEFDRQRLAQAQQRYPTIAASPALSEALCGASQALGIDSLRVPLMALRVARAAAALDGAASVGSVHAALAARLVIAPRARVPPAPTQAPPPEPSAADAEPQAPAQAADVDGGDAESSNSEQDLGEIVLDAVRAALPADLLEQMGRGLGRHAPSAMAGRTGVQLRSKLRGRPVGSRRGELRAGARLHVLETLRAAAPWQGLRGRLAPAPGAAPAPRRRIAVRREDFRIVRFSQRAQTTVIFAVDASGSAALHRLAEAKGAVETFLADCYVRRDQVALIAFRGRDAQLLLPPTRSLARARRCLAEAPGGGGTPVAAGLRAAAGVADTARRQGATPLLVVLTDGKANVALDGAGGRERAAADALALARVLRGTGLRSLLIDFSPRPAPEAQNLAQALGARYLPLPYAEAAQLAQAVRAARLEAV